MVVVVGGLPGWVVMARGYFPSSQVWRLPSTFDTCQMFCEEALDSKWRPHRILALIFYLDQLFSHTFYLGFKSDIIAGGYALLHLRYGTLYYAVVLMRGGEELEENSVSSTSRWGLMEDRWSQSWKLSFKYCSELLRGTERSPVVKTATSAVLSSMSETEKIQCGMWRHLVGLGSSRMVQSY